MNKVLIEYGETTHEYLVPYAVARSISNILNYSQNTTKAEIDTEYFEQIKEQNNE